MRPSPARGCAAALVLLLGLAVAGSAPGSRASDPRGPRLLMAAHGKLLVAAPRRRARTLAGQGFKGWPSFSPDGTLLLASSTRAGFGSPPGRLALVTENADGSGIRPVTQRAVRRRGRGALVAVRDADRVHAAQRPRQRRRRARRRARRALRVRSSRARRTSASPRGRRTGATSPTSRTRPARTTSGCTPSAPARNRRSPPSRGAETQRRSSPPRAPRSCYVTTRAGAPTSSC